MKKLQIDQIFNIKNKICIVSGAMGGIGSVIAKGLINNGAKVIAIDKVYNREIFKNYEIDFKKVDIKNILAVKKFANYVEKKYKKIDALLNISGITDPNNFKKNIDNNLVGPFNLISNIIKVIIKNGTGSIVNITSLNAELGFSDNPGYNSSKGGLKLLSKSLAIDYAKYNIRVNNIGPGYFLTDMTKKFYRQKEKRKLRLSRIPMNRYGLPEELFGIIVYLISGASSYVTGQDFYIDGGLLAKGL